MTTLAGSESLGPPQRHIIWLQSSNLLVLSLQVENADSDKENAYRMTEETITEAQLKEGLGQSREQCRMILASGKFGWAVRSSNVIWYWFAQTYLFLSTQWLWKTTMELRTKFSHSLQQVLILHQFPCYTSLPVDTWMCSWKAIADMAVPASELATSLAWYSRMLRMRRGPSTNICKGKTRSRTPT